MEKQILQLLPIHLKEVETVHIFVFPSGTLDYIRGRSISCALASFSLTIHPIISCLFLAFSFFHLESFRFNTPNSRGGFSCYPRRDTFALSGMHVVAGICVTISLSVMFVTFSSFLLFSPVRLQHDCFSFLFAFWQSSYVIPHAAFVFFVFGITLYTKRFTNFTKRPNK